MSDTANELPSQAKGNDGKKRKRAACGEATELSEPLRMLSDVAAGQLQPASLLQSLTAATAQLRMGEVSSQARATAYDDGAPASELSRQQKDAMHEARHLLDLAAAAPAGHWSGAAVAQLTHCTVLVRLQSCHGNGAVQAEDIITSTKGSGLICVHFTKIAHEADFYMLVCDRALTTRHNPVTSAASCHETADLPGQCPRKP